MGSMRVNTWLYGIKDVNQLDLSEGMSILSSSWRRVIVMTTPIQLFVIAPTKMMCFLSILDFLSDKRLFTIKEAYQKELVNSMHVYFLFSSEVEFMNF